MELYLCFVEYQKKTKLLLDKLYGCDYISAFDGFVRIPNSTCGFTVRELCNKITDCSDAADEKNCPNNLVLCDIEDPASGLYDKRECGPDRYCSIAEREKRLMCLLPEIKKNT